MIADDVVVFDRGTAVHNLLYHHFHSLFVLQTAEAYYLANSCLTCDLMSCKLIMDLQLHSLLCFSSRLPGQPGVSGHRRTAENRHLALNTGLASFPLAAQSDSDSTVGVKSQDSVQYQDHEAGQL